MTVSDTAGSGTAGSPAPEPRGTRPHGYSGAKHLAAWYAGDLTAARAAAAEKARCRIAPTVDGEDVHLGRKLSALYAGDLGSLLGALN